MMAQLHDAGVKIELSDVGIVPPEIVLGHAEGDMGFGDAEFKQIPPPLVRSKERFVSLPPFWCGVEVLGIVVLNDSCFERAVGLLQVHPNMYTSAGFTLEVGQPIVEGKLHMVLKGRDPYIDPVPT